MVTIPSRSDEVTYDHQDAAYTVNDNGTLQVVDGQGETVVYSPSGWTSIRTETQKPFVY
jgi:hypothetical protein